MTLTILLADDHNLLAEAVGNMLNAKPDYEAITTDSLDGALSLLNGRNDIDLVLLDLKMPGMMGLASIKMVIDKAGDGKVALFTGMVDRHFLNSALELGCCGLIPKTMPLQSLNSVIQLIMSGQVFVPMDTTQNGAEKSGGDAELTSKELFVLRLAADGLTNKEIARDMNTSEVTIKMHMRSICKKLGARNRAHAAMISRERALI
ncbi:response regulator transcription factor [Roseovarius sp. EGI FJ00037]|uniref:LuxR C-terminal-related transcriptional regulator n=1 Tax=Roseovarius TaxID=74030 RepID=UPI0022A81949|nr:response regulator transcription factor [Roseovarius sp. EGI FJ00037]MCZ0813477.1 response regulator transcription factor [Roseovarius sp. EGI FJ00037]